MSFDILVQIPDAVLVHIPVVGIVGDEPCEAVLALENSYLIMKGFDLFVDEFSDVRGLFPIIDSQFLVLLHSLVVQFLFMTLKEFVYLLIDLLFVFLQLVVDTFPKSHQVVINAVISAGYLLEHHYMLVALLLGFVKHFI